jgi:hypothetical protein
VRHLCALDLFAVSLLVHALLAGVPVESFRIIAAWLATLSLSIPVCKCPLSSCPLPVHLLGCLVLPVHTIRRQLIGVCSPFVAPSGRARSASHRHFHC